MEESPKSQAAIQRDNIVIEATRKAEMALPKRSRIITGASIESEWRSYVNGKTSQSAIENQISTLVGNSSLAKGRLAKRTSSPSSYRTATTERIFDVPHSPFRNRFAVELPSNRIELLNRFRYYYKHEPMVRAAIDLHTEYPLSTFEIKHEDPVLQEEFNDIIEELNLVEFCMTMAHEYWLVGEAWPFGIWDDNEKPQIWKHFMLLNPAQVEAQFSPMTDGRSNLQIRLHLDNLVRAIVQAGPRDKKTGALYARLPSDVIQAVKSNNGLMELNPIQASCFKRIGNPFSPRGESLLYSIMHILSYRDKLRDAMYASADRHATAREVWKLGSDQQPATDDEIVSFSQLIQDSYLDPTQAIIWNHALQYEMTGGSDKFMPVRAEIQAVEEEMLIGLMLNKGFLDSSYGAYANMSVSLDVLISRYLTFRTRLEYWMRECVFAPICRIHHLYKPTKAELDHRIRIKGGNKRPWTPDFHWSKQELRDPTQKINMLMQFRDKLGAPGYPRDMMYQLIGENADTIKKKCTIEKRELAMEGINLQGQQGGGMGGPGMMGGMGGGMGDMGAPMPEIGGGMEGGSMDLGAPGGGPNQPGGASLDMGAGGQAAGNMSINNTVPPASSSAMGGAT